jgi:hypothetical protein
VSDESDPTRLPDPLEQAPGITSQVSQLPPGAENQQVVFLRDAALVVNFLPDQHQHPLVSVLVIVLWAGYQYVVIGDDHGIKTGAQRGLGDVGVASMPIRVVGMHVEVSDDFVHRRTMFL